MHEHHITSFNNPIPRYFTMVHQWNLNHRVKVWFSKGGFLYHIISGINSFHAFSGLHKYHALSGFHKTNKLSCPFGASTNILQNTLPTTIASLKSILHLLPSFTIIPLSPPSKIWMKMAYNGAHTPRSSTMFQAKLCPSPWTSLPFPKGEWSPHTHYHIQNPIHRRNKTKKEKQEIFKNTIHFSHCHTKYQKSIMQSFSLQCILHWHIPHTCRYTLQYFKKKNEA